MSARLRSIVVLGALASFASTAAAAPDAEGEAVAALLDPGSGGGGASPDDGALDALLAREDLDPWLLAEHLLARNRQEVAARVARRADERKVGPLLAYADGPDATRGVAERMRTLVAATAAQESERFDAALEILARARPLETRSTVFGARLSALRGEFLARSGRRLESIDAWLAGAEEAMRIRWSSGADRYFVSARDAAYAVRNLELMGQAAEGLRAVMDLVGDGERIAQAEQDLGTIAEARGDLPRARRHFGEAMSLFEALGNADGVAVARSQRSAVLAEMGEFGAALEEQAALAARYAKRPRDAEWAENEIRAGLLRHRMGDERAAAAAFARALEVARNLDDPAGEGVARGNLGVAHAQVGEWEEAIAAYRAVLTLFERVADPLGVATAKQNLADAVRGGAETELARAMLVSDPATIDAARARAREALTEARTLADEALAGARDTGAAQLVCVVHQTIGQILLAQGKAAEAVASLEATRDEAARLRTWSVEVAVTAVLARGRLALDDFPGAMREARRAAVQLSSALGGLPDADMARVQSLTPDVYDIGIRAALRLKSLDDLTYFLEAGRAAALLRGLGGRAVALRATVPAAVEARLADASRVKVETFATWQKARSGELAVLRRHSKAYDDARAAEQSALEAVLQAQTAAAERLAPARLVSIADVRSRLRATARPGLKQVFVVFNLQDTEGVALLIEESGPRLVHYVAADLGSLRHAFATLAASRDGVLDAAALAVVRRVLFDPMKLPAGPTRLLVCPDRELAYVPLAAIFPDDWEFAWEPSATTFDLLAERRIRKGKGMLAVGDPDYRVAANADAMAMHSEAPDSPSSRAHGPRSPRSQAGPAIVDSWAARRPSAGLRGNSTPPAPIGPGGASTSPATAS